MGPTWGPSGADRTQVGPMLAPWTLLSGLSYIIWYITSHHIIYYIITDHISNIYLILYTSYVTPHISHHTSHHTTPQHMETLVQEAQILDENKTLASGHLDIWHLVFGKSRYVIGIYLLNHNFLKRHLITDLMFRPRSRHFLAATKQLYDWFSPSVRPSVCPSVRLSVCHTFFTMFPSSYHHEIFRSYYHGQKWCPCKRSRSEVKGQGHRGQHPT